MYALVGGAALVGAAVAFHLLSKSSDEVEDSLESDLEQLGALQLDANGRIEFAQFLKIFQICSFYGKTQFNARKKEMVAKRRQAFKAGDESTYEQLVMQMTQEEEMLVQSKLQEILERLGVSEQEFQQSTMFHGQDQRKGMQIMQMQQSQQGQTDSNQEPLSRDKALEAFKVQQEIQMDSMDDMMKSGMMNEQQPGGQGQMEMMMKMMVQQAKSSDKLFERIGIEEDELNNSIVKLNLQQDPEFMKLVNDNMQKVMAKAQQAQGGMGGGPPMGGIEGMGGMPPMF